MARIALRIALLSSLAAAACGDDPTPPAALPPPAPYALEVRTESGPVEGEELGEIRNRVAIVREGSADRLQVTIEDDAKVPGFELRNETPGVVFARLLRSGDLLAEARVPPRDAWFVDPGD